MWTPNDGHSIEERGRVNAAADVVAMDERAIAEAMPIPNGTTLNVTKSSKVHIGPKFVSVTQNVQSVEQVKELPLPMYLWNIVKNSSRTERLSCAAALIVLVTCITLIVYFTVVSANNAGTDDRPSEEWNITREMWLAQPYDYHTLVKEEFRPMMLVIIQHTVSGECSTLAQCAAELRNIQGYYLKSLHYDIPYNFMIGNDGRVYEGRGWLVTGAHTMRYNLCSVGIGFIGDYREEKLQHSRVTELQLERMKLVLDEGVKKGYLRPDYQIVGAKDLVDTASPGSNLMNALTKLDNYDHQHRFVNLNCSQMQDKYGNVPL